MTTEKQMLKTLFSKTLSFLKNPYFWTLNLTGIASKSTWR